MSRHRRPARTRATRAVTPDARPLRPSGPRVAGIDALRGAALCLMFVYHFAFDLRFYRVIAADFEHDPFWLGFRALIVASFMALVGVSLVLADRAGVSSARFWQRIGVIVACALAVSAASWIVFPRSFIYFGILHAIAVASMLARPLVHRPWIALVIGCVVIAAGFGWSNPVFDAGPLSWIGFVTAKPATEDYVPLAPWAGFVLLGITLGHRLARDDFSVLAPIAATPSWLQWLGRHSLAVYMVHQPILLGALWVAFGR